MYKRTKYYKLYESGKTTEIMSWKVFWIIFLTLIKIRKRKRNAETFFQRELLLYVLLLIINFYDIWYIVYTYYILYTTYYIL